MREVKVGGVRVHGLWECTPAEEPVSGEQPEISVGSGKYLVYGLYDEHQKDDARAKGEDRWRVKVGKTRGRSPYDRIYDGAFLPDKLLWGVGIWTDNPDGDERLLQAALEARGRRYEGTGGREWFVTNPQEIAEVYRSIVGG